MTFGKFKFLIIKKKNINFIAIENCFVKGFENRLSFYFEEALWKVSKVDTRVKQRISTYINQHPYATFREIFRLSNMPVKEKQIYYIRRKLGFISDVDKKFIELILKYKETRLVWVIKHFDNSFENIIFKDEKPFVIKRIKRKGYCKTNAFRLK